MNNIYEVKTAIVTGGSRGIGRAISEILASHGCNVVINYVSDDVSAFEVKEEMQKKYGVQVLLCKGDVSDEAFVKKMVDTVKSEFGHIDYLINNAGIAIDTTLEDKTVDNFRRILDVNLIGTFLLCKYVGKVMMDANCGSIVTISSTNGIDSYYPYGMDYDASKAGVINLTHNFAIEYAPNVRVNSVAPGWVKTDAIKELDEEQLNEEYKHILLGRFAEPKEIAEAVYFVLTSTYMNDSIVKIDGGRC